MTSSLSRCPIEDVLPWMNEPVQKQTVSSSHTRQNVRNNHTVVVADRVESSGRFLFFVTAANAFRSSSEDRILWLSCSGAYTNEHTRQGLKKLGCTLAAGLPTQTTADASSSAAFIDATGRFTIRSVAHELAALLTEHSESLHAERFVRDLYHDVQMWLHQQGASDKPCVIMLDDVSALADLVGPKLAYALVFQTVCLVNKKEQCRLLVRCAGDALGTSTDPENEWIGHGGGGTDMTHTHLPHAWESSLVEIADWMVDVLPLQSGYSREAHGRILLTSRTTAMEHTPVRYNYCLTDQAVFAIRLTPQMMR